jgi:hypothetical protein
MAAMRQRMTSALCRAALGMLFLSASACATQRQRGFSIEATTGSRTGNPFEIRLTAQGPELRAVLVNRSSSKQPVLHDAHLQASTLELIAATGSRHKPYDSRMIEKNGALPYCGLFVTLSPGSKLVLGSMPLRKSRDGFQGQWGPFNFDELPSGDYQARVSWNSERAQCLDDGTRKLHKVPSLWRGIVHSNQVTLHLP